MKDFAVVGGKALRCGYTTGTVFTAAACLAIEGFCRKTAPDFIDIELPSGDNARLYPHSFELTANGAVCSVIKDAGDDPDVTNGAAMFAKVTAEGEGVVLTGGEGIGIVTRDGLKIKKGEYAINPVPRQMIERNAAVFMAKHGIKGIKIELFCPEGREIAKSTFNSRLGIEGGISVLGTTGIVTPMSDEALMETTHMLIDSHFQNGKKVLLLTPGEYGEDFCRSVLKIDMERAIKCSNFIGDAIDYGLYRGFENILIIGHMGKLIKLSGGITNTHSKTADCRMELIALFAALSGADTELLNSIMGCISAEQAFDLLYDTPYYNNTLKIAAERTAFYLNHRIKGRAKWGVLMFCGRHILKTEGADALLDKIGEEI